MTYSRYEFASDLEHFLLRRKNLDYVELVGWAYETRLSHLGAIDPTVSEWLLQLGAMDMGAEFELTKEELLALVVTARKP